MKLEEYFDIKKGIGVLSTADSEDKVDAAIYARPHFMEDGSLAIIPFANSAIQSTLLPPRSVSLAATFPITEAKTSSFPAKGWLKSTVIFPLLVVRI